MVWGKGVEHVGFMVEDVKNFRGCMEYGAFTVRLGIERGLVSGQGLCLVFRDLGV